MKYLFGTIVITLIALSFIGPKCDHVFTQVERDTVKVEVQDFGYSITLPVYHRPTGIHEGIELICVKCFHKQRQLMDYGQPASPCLVWPDNSPLNLSGCCDTFRSWTSIDTSAIHIVGDSLIWNK